MVWVSGKVFKVFANIVLSQFGLIAGRPFSAKKENRFSLITLSESVLLAGVELTKRTY